MHQANRVFLIGPVLTWPVQIRPILVGPTGCQKRRVPVGPGQFGQFHSRHSHEGGPRRTAREGGCPAGWGPEGRGAQKQKKKGEGGPKGAGPRRWGARTVPEGWRARRVGGPKCRACFSLSRSMFAFFLSLSLSEGGERGSSRGIVATGRSR